MSANTNISYPTSICGVYCITDIKNDRHYVGATTNLFGRWAFHVHEALTAAKYDLHLEMAKRPLSDFHFQILESCPDFAAADDLESKYIATFMGQGRKLYNKRKTTPGDNPYLIAVLRARSAQLASKGPVLKQKRRSPVKLSPQQKALIVLLIGSGLDQRPVAQLFSVSQSHVSNIVNGRT